MNDLAKIKKAKHIFIQVKTAKTGVIYAKISRKEALFLLDGDDGDFAVDFESKHLNEKHWTEAFIKPAQ